MGAYRNDLTGEINDRTARRGNCALPVETPRSAWSTYAGGDPRIMFHVEHPAIPGARGVGKLLKAACDPPATYEISGRSHGVDGALHLPPAGRQTQESLQPFAGRPRSPDKKVCLPDMVTTTERFAAWRLRFLFFRDVSRETS